MAEGTFSPVPPCKRTATLPASLVPAAGGPSSNTGQKSLTQPMIDFCVAVLDSDKAKRLFRKMAMSEVLRYVYGTGDAIACGGLVDRVFNFYQRSCTMVDRNGNVCGKIGLRDDGAIQISLAGQGCAHVPSWARVADVLDDLHCRISHVDIAVDDLTGSSFNLAWFREQYHAGAFTKNGRPPHAQHVSDEGSGKGCSFYVGQRGHLQLNAYEKGKQLGDPESPHVRAEVRMYAKRIDVPNDVLRNPGVYFASAYPLLAQFVVGEVCRLGLKDQVVNLTARAAVRFLRTQAGTTFNAIFDAFGRDAEAFMGFCQDEILRTDCPGRWKGITGDLTELLRAQLLTQPENQP